MSLKVSFTGQSMPNLIALHCQCCGWKPSSSRRKRFSASNTTSENLQKNEPPQALRLIFLEVLR